MGEKNWMKKVVFFTDMKKLHEALNYFDFESFSKRSVPIKLHMGEMKNKYFPKPDIVKPVVDELKKIHSDPYLFDTTVAYSGLRHTKSGYKKLAKIHSFSIKKIGCNVVIDDTGVQVNVENRDYEVADHLFRSTHIFAFSHVKGHVASGMGGAIKNLGMGGVTKETKIKIHNGSKPNYNKDNCTFCGVCAEACPFNAIKVKEDSWDRNKRKCFGCSVCIDNCSNNALSNVDLNIQQALAYSAYACVKDKNVIYLNDVNRIARSCDCDPFAGPLICPDVGFLVSDDIVAIDKASLDLINEIKKDVFIEENKIDPIKQIKYGEEIGLGSTSYQLIKL